MVTLWKISTSFMSFFLTNTMQNGSAARLWSQRPRSPISPLAPFGEVNPSFFFSSVKAGDHTLLTLSPQHYHQNSESNPMRNKSTPCLPRHWRPLPLQVPFQLAENKVDERATDCLGGPGGGGCSRCYVPALMIAVDPTTQKLACTSYSDVLAGNGSKRVPFYP
ncbi:hypothetical protein B0T20DRAFT_410831 [Sordaria brevicollis]|uniref:Uncharacterized protein n=1 Tax=Sordaria brevicollis TaxID=83679 RepID=A0AAE0UCD7_SORBR|nr:hypothetical protein B0T20DRAFT_410831 [Sordaria brevicollis]